MHNEKYGKKREGKAKRKKERILMDKMRVHGRRDTYFAFMESPAESKHEARFLDADHPLHYRGFVVACSFDLPP